MATQKKKRSDSQIIIYTSLFKQIIILGNRVCNDTLWTNVGTVSQETVCAHLNFLTTKLVFGVADMVARFSRYPADRGTNKQPCENRTFKVEVIILQQVSTMNNNISAACLCPLTVSTRDHLDGTSSSHYTQSATPASNPLIIMHELILKSAWQPIPVHILKMQIHPSPLSHQYAMLWRGCTCR